PRPRRSRSRPARGSRLPRPSSSRHLRPSLEQQHVTPHPVQLAEPLTHADEPEAAHEVQPEAGLVLREDPGLERPDAGRLRAPDQLFEELAPDAAPADLFGDVDARL